MINKVILLGNLGKDPDTRFTSSGKAVTRFSLATSNTWIGTNGEKQQATEWHTVVVWGKQGEACSQYLEKGRQVYVEGELRHRSYDNKEGKEQRRDPVGPEQPPTERAKRRRDGLPNYRLVRFADDWCSRWRVPGPTPRRCETRPQGSCPRWACAYRRRRP